MIRRILHRLPLCKSSLSLFYAHERLHPLPRPYLDYFSIPLLVLQLLVDLSLQSLVLLSSLAHASLLLVIFNSILPHMLNPNCRKVPLQFQHYTKNLYYLCVKTLQRFKHQLSPQLYILFPLCILQSSKVQTFTAIKV